MSLGVPRLHLRETDSTSERARALAAAGAPHGTLVTAAAQTDGRGRQGRTWSAPPGRALLLSLVLRDPPALLPLRAAVAVADTVDGAAPGGMVAGVVDGGGTVAGGVAGAAAGDGARIKWPNDVLLGGRKVAGILVEGRPQERWGVLGIGANVAVAPADLPAELRERAGGLGLAPPDVEPVLAALLAALELRLEQDPAALLDDWRARDALHGQEITWDGAARRGVAAGVDAEGRLLVDRPGGQRVTLDAGEVHLGGVVI